LHPLKHFLPNSAEIRSIGSVTTVVGSKDAQRMEAYHHAVPPIGMFPDADEIFRPNLFG